MNKILICASCMMLGAGAAFAVPSYAGLATEGVEGDTGGYASCYTAYLCTETAAVSYFGGANTYDGVTEWLAASGGNYANGLASLAGSEMASDGFAYGEYMFSKYFASLTEGEKYLAVVTYANDENYQFRVFEGVVDEGEIALGPTYGDGAAGAWTAAAVVPEPTSGLLLLMGLAGLALRRRRAA